MDFLAWFFRGDTASFSGIPRFNIYFMRVIYGLMFFLLGMDVWSHIFSHEGRWNASDAMDWSVWAAFSLMAGIGLFRTVEMIPILLLEIIYKLIWLMLVALPVWLVGGDLMNSTDGMFFPFVLVVLPILAVPWRYVFRRYFMNAQMPRN